MAARPLRGVRVVDLSDPWAGRAGGWLADLGAEVERIDLRKLSRAGAAQLRDRLAAADIVFESLDPAAPPELRDALTGAVAGQPGLVRVSVTGFGRSGPRRGAAFCDLTLSAAGGALHTCGDRGGAPTPQAGRPAYHAAALYMVAAALAGLARRRRSGRGAAIEVSAQEAVASMLEHVLVQYLGAGQVAVRQGALAWNGATFIVPCRDGHIVASIASQWDTLVEWLAADGMAADLADPRWRDTALRTREVGHVAAVIARWSRTKTVDALFETAQALRMPWAPVRTPAQVRRCPQLAARGFSGIPYRFTAPAPASAPRPACTPAPDCTARAQPPVSVAPLHGVRVLDFSWVLAGPHATRILGDLGAEVFKLQSARTGVAPEPGPYDAMWNRNKLGFALDMGHPQARELVLALVTRCDVLVENFAPRVLGNWGLDDELLHAANPRLVVLHMSALGASGPWREHVGFGPGLHALAGLTHLGSADPQRPTGWGHAHADHVMGLFGAIAVLAGLEQRERHGHGAAVDLSGLEAIATLGLEPPGREGAPEGVYRCRGGDAYCALSVRGDAEWRRFAAVVAEPWALEPAFATVAGRTQHATRLHRLVGGWTAGRDGADIVAALDGAGLAAAFVNDAQALFHDPQLRERGFFVEVPHPLRGRTWIDRNPIRFADDASVRHAPAPKLGEHTAQVLRELLGLGQTEVERLRQGGVLR